jgi:hypothetical protein
MNHIPKPNHIYTLPEFYSEKPHGDFLVRDDAGKVWSVFQCHGCQTCFSYDDETDSVTQVYPHFYRCDEVT